MLVIYVEVRAKVMGKGKAVQEETLDESKRQNQILRGCLLHQCEERDVSKVRENRNSEG